MPSPGTVTRLLDQVRQESPEALDQLFERTYDDLRRLAAGRVRRSGARLINGTALAHEAFLRMATRDRFDASCRAQFMALFAQALHDTLVELIRRESAQRRGGDARHVEWQEPEGRAALPRLEVLAVHETLEALAAADPEVAAIVDFRVFAGATIETTAELLGIPVSAVNRGWKYGRAWIAARLESQRASSLERDPRA